MRTPTIIAIACMAWLALDAIAIAIWHMFITRNHNDPDQ